MNPQQQELLEKLRSATNILVTVSANPSVDQLAACIGMTLTLNKLKKHATAVFSGQVPSTIEFLKPEETIEKNTDSLRDFIISLDKSKADKLRYKVEDQVVRIFITPYRTSISDKDLDFSQGDFNVDVVLCLGVNQQQDLDQAITAHGRILHDATVMCISTQAGGELGSINWTEPAASSLSELCAELIEILGKELLDGQIATSLLTGIVAETDRFSNEKTSPETMRLSAELMAAGANQQLVANELETKPEAAVPIESAAEAETDAEQPADTVDSDGTLEITHPAPDLELDDTSLPPSEPAQAEAPGEPEVDVDVPNKDEEFTAEPEITDEPAQSETANGDDASPVAPPPASRIMLQPPSLGGTLTANSIPQDAALQDPLTAQPTEPTGPILDRQPPAGPGSGTVSTPTNGEESAPAQPLEPTLQPAAPVAEPPVETETVPLPEPVIQMPATQSTADDSQTASNVPQTLSDLEAATHSPHVAQTQASSDSSVAPLSEDDLEAARDAVNDAINSAPPTAPLPPTAAAGATGYLNVQDQPAAANEATTTQPDLTEAAANNPATQPDAAQPLPPPATSTDNTASSSNSATNSPPPVPPPLPLNELSKFLPPNQ